MPSVTIYTTPSCTYCRMAKEFFRQNNVEFEEVDVAMDKQKAKEMVEKSGQLGVPVIDVGGKIIVGFDKSALREALNL